MTQPPTFYSIAELAELVGVSERQVWRWIGLGHLPVHKFGRRTLVSGSDARRFFKSARRRRPSRKK